MNKNLPLSLPTDSFEITTPFEGDQLGRAALATQLGGYIDRLKAGAVLGIDAPWGEGKTWFGRHWAEKLKVDHKVAFIDAFENDYVDDPFVLITSDLSNLFDDPEGDGATLRKKAAGVLKAIVPMSTKAVINLAGRLLVGTSDVSDVISDAVKEGTESAADEAGKWIEKRIEAMAAERASLNGFRSVLADAALKSERPVVVFIDELDRCKPSFAVTLIERIKHLFDVPNLVFVLLLNRRQMEVAIEGQYGQGTDGQAYLGKFVNLWFDLPKAMPGTGHTDNRVGAYTTQVLSKYGFEPEKNRDVESRPRLALRRRRRRGYDRARALFPADVLAWVQATQPKAWETLTKNHGAKAAETLLDPLRAQLDQRGTLDVLRHGVELLGLKQPLKLAEFKPALAINPDILARYAANRLRVVRQVRYSLHNENSIDLVLFLNGLPVATVELKTDFTQSVATPSTSTASTATPSPRGRPPSRCSASRGGAGALRGEQREVHMVTTRLAGPATCSCPSTRATTARGQPVNPGRPPHRLPVGAGLGARELAGDPRPLPDRPARQEEADHQRSSSRATTSST
jgi:hypothetical protein